MKILIISHMFPSKHRPASGAFVFQQVKPLKKLGHEVTVICPLPWIPRWVPAAPDRWRQMQCLPDHDLYEGINVYYPRGLTIPQKMLYLRGRSYYFSLKSFFKKLFSQQEFDIIHSHTVMPDGDLGRFLKKKFNIPLVITIHGADLQVLAERSYKYNLRVYKILGQADGIGLVSKKLQGQLYKKAPEGFRFPEVKVVYNGIQIYDNYPAIDWEIKEPVIKMLTIANLIEQKGFGLVFEAMKNLKFRFPQLRYFIIGQGWDRKKIEEQAAKFGLQDRVVFLGSMPHRKAMAYLKEADLFIMPSKNEALGVVYLESMSFGNITIGSQGEGIAEIINDGENGYLVDPLDPESLQKKLEFILPRLKELQILKQKAKERVWPEFSWENNAREYIDLYTGVRRQGSGDRRQEAHPFPAP